MSILAIIPARGGSKGVPRKNIKLMAGQPLIGWTINAAKRVSSIDSVIVSTEDAEIADVARKLGADVPFLRPPELATDDAPSIASVIHLIEQLAEFEWVLLLQPTSPLRTAIDIEGIIKFCQERGGSSAVSLCEVQEHPYWMYSLDGKERLCPVISREQQVERRQDLPKAYVLNGALYLAKRDWLLEHKTFIGSDTLGYLMPLERSFDIDTLFDWDWVEFLISKKERDT